MIFVGLITERARRHASALPTDPNVASLPSAVRKEIGVMRTFASILAALGLVFILSSNASAQTGPIPSKASVHSIWSMEAFVLDDPIACISYNKFYSSDCALAWKENPPVDAIASAGSHFFNAFVLPVAPMHLAYEFRLVNAYWSNDDEIRGVWMVLKNGVVQTKNCQGTAYGLKQASGGGNYFKLYCSDPNAPSVCDAVPKWGFIGFITKRYDY
jgi:hypothetical protein